MSKESDWLALSIGAAFFRLDPSEKMFESVDQNFLQTLYQVIDDNVVGEYAISKVSVSRLVSTNSNEFVINSYVNGSFEKADGSFTGVVQRIGKIPTVEYRLCSNSISLTFVPAKEHQTYFEVILLYSVRPGARIEVVKEYFSKIFTTAVIMAIVERYLWIIDSHAARQIYQRMEIVASYANPSTLLTLALSKSYFKSSRLAIKELAPESPETWMFAVYSGECLRKEIIGDKILDRLEVGSAQCGWNSKLTRIHDCGGKNTLSPCALPALRKAIWKIKNEKPGAETGENKSSKGHCSPNCLSIVAKHKGIVSPLDVADSISKLTIMCIPAFNTELIPSVQSTTGTIPSDISSKLFSWSFGKRPSIELANTVLFAIYTLATEDNPPELKEVLLSINTLWKQITDINSGSGLALSAFLNEYLQQWQSDGQIYLNPDWLMSWFAVELFKSKTFKVYTCEAGNNSYCEAEQLQFHKHLAVLCMYSLFWMRCFGETLDEKFSDVKGGYQELLDSLLYLLSEYAYIDGKLPRTAGLKKIMYFMWGQQAALYALSETYRDHLHHVVEVCLLGMYFMRLKINNSRLFFRFGPSLDSPLDIRNWIVGSLLHDMGYSLKLVSYPLEHLGFFQEDVCETFWRKLGEEYKVLQAEYASKSVDALKPGVDLNSAAEGSVNHGVLSALIIASHLNSVDTPEWRRDMQMAIEAAALHDFKSERISPKKHPMAFLLWFCDNLQEWDRPLLQGHQFRQSLLVNIVRSPDHATHSNRPYVKYLAINATLCEDNCGKIIGDSLKCRMVFERPDDVQHFPPFTWVGHMQQMQRVTQCVLPIELTLEHPLLKAAANGASRYSLECFQTFLNDEDNGSMKLRKSSKRIVDNAALRQWAVDLHSDNNWYRYERDEETFDDSKERFVFDLSLCEGESVILKTPDEFIPDYKKWLSKFRKT